ncbi:MAG: hypothetical protein ACP6IY_18810 [Promethearchaeia archaeon]
MLDKTLSLLNTIFMPVDYFIKIAFFWCPSILRTFSASMLVLTLGAILSISGKTLHKIIKYLLYLGFLLYTIYIMGILSKLNEIDLLDFTALTFSIIAPICMIIVGKKAAATKIKGYKIFNFYTMWIIYLIVAILYALYYPGLTSILRSYLIMFSLLYILISLFTVYIFNIIIGGA